VCGGLWICGFAVEWGVVDLRVCSRISGKDGVGGFFYLASVNLRQKNRLIRRVFGRIVVQAFRKSVTCSGSAHLILSRFEWKIAQTTSD